MTQPDNGLNLSPEIKGRALIPLHDMPFEFRISDKCRAELEKMEQRRARALATAHLYWFD